MLVLQRAAALGDDAWEDRELDVVVGPDGRIALERYVGFGEAKRPGSWTGAVPGEPRGER